MFHSLPAAVIFGELAFLLMSGDAVLRWYKAGAVTLGYLSHLVLDEMYSVEYVRGRMTLKRSFGTAVKLLGQKWLPNLLVYGSLALLSFLVWKEPNWMAEHSYQQRLGQATAEVVERIVEFSEGSTAQRSQSNDSALTPGGNDRLLPANRWDSGDAPRTGQAPDGYVR
jgi:hypothetical protein